MSAPQFPGVYQPQPQPKPKRPKVVRNVVLAIVGALVLLIIVGTAIGSGKKGNPKAGGSPAAAAPTARASAAPVSPAATASAAPAVTVTRTVTKIVFRVTGSAPDGANITYGSDSNNISPPGTLGVLGNGTPLPFAASLRYHTSALYYDVDAQLQGSGNIRCSVSAKVTRYWSDGTHLTRSKIIARGHAENGYNICDAQVNN
jgi:hypothetical protein